jgi:hypothetical protein
VLACLMQGLCQVRRAAVFPPRRKAIFCQQEFKFFADNPIN